MLSLEKNCNFTSLAENYFDLLAIDFRQRNNLLSSYFHNSCDLIEWDARMLNYLKALKLITNETNNYINDQLSNSLLTQGEIFTIGIYACHVDNVDFLKTLFELNESIAVFDYSFFEYLIHWCPNNSVFWSLICQYPAYQCIASFFYSDLVAPPYLSDEVVDSISSKEQWSFSSLYFLFLQSKETYIEIINILFLGSERMLLTAIQSVLHIFRLTNSLFIPKMKLLFHLEKLLENSEIEICEEAGMCLAFSSVFAENLDSILNKIKEKNIHIYLKILGWSGKIDAINTLFLYLDSKQYAKIAAAAIYVITGSNPEDDDWFLEIEEQNETFEQDNNDDEIPNVYPEDVFLTPSKDLFIKWWKKNKDRFTNENIYFMGNKISEINFAQQIDSEPLMISQIITKRLFYQSKKIFPNRLKHKSCVIKGL